jgi:UDP-N-acetylglucosamine--N-acetylmuramyl-(pentapeptide) pyrophosphoryl-undecaprenol N-acetylglucosamine transferase
MKVLIAAGGTGGHIYPGIAVAKEIMRRDAVLKFFSSEQHVDLKLGSFRKMVFSFL